MKIECPHCDQSIDLGEDPPSEFSCPTCNGYIQLQLKAEAKKTTSEPALQGFKLPVLLGSIAAAIVISLFVGWLVWGGGDPASNLPLNERIIGTWHEQTEQPGAVYFQFSGDGRFEWGGIEKEHGKTRYVPMSRGEFRIEENFLQRRFLAPKRVIEYSEWKIQKVSLKDDVLTVYPSEGKKTVFTYRRVPQ
ncbi:MAG: hypothetical protein ACSHX9_12140 [Luteolibacter sp.]